MNGELVSSQQTYACQYSFATDPNAGAIGTVQLQQGKFLQPFTYIKSIRIRATSLFTVAGITSTISFGLVEVAVPAPNTYTNALSATYNTLAFNQEDANGNFITIVGNCTFPKILNPSYITMFIGNAAITAGSLNIVIDTDQVSNQ